MKYSDFPSYVRNEQSLLNRHVAGAADLRICAHDGAFDADPKLDESNYTAKRGSPVLELSPTFLEGLSTGKHVVTALFDDGKAQASFVMSSKKAGPEVKPSGKAPGTDGAPPATGTTSASTRLAKTGDDMPIGAVMAPCVLGLVSLAMSLRARRRR